MTTQFAAGRETYTKEDILRTDYLLNKGVYKITNMVNGKTYIGQTTRNFYTRWKEHLKRLNLNKHENIYLQNSYNKHGVSNFKFEILEIVGSDDVEYFIGAEQKYIDTLKPEYNLCLFALKGGNSGELSEEYKLKLSVSHRTDHIQTNNTSGVRGVYWKKRGNKWCARITVNKKNISLGCFKTKEEAVTARKDAELLYWGDTITLNKVVKRKEKRSIAKSGYKHIDWYKPRSTWRVRVKHHFVGTYKNIEDAIVARDNYLESLVK